MDTGPRARAGFDLALTELLDDDGHRFVVEVGSERGAEVLDGARHARPAAEDDVARADARRRASARRRWAARSTPTDIRDLLQGNAEHPRWDEVADRCLSCGNCTLVCPTCFCSTVEDTTDLAGGETERTRLWDSCFTLEHSYMHGGSVRGSARSRYRQWMTHKLSTWIDQFGTSGCVGCGRCITWCPVAIDITEEAAAIRANDLREDAMRTIEELLGEVPALRALAPEHRDDDRRLRAQPRLRARRAGSCARASRPTRSTSSAHGAVALETVVPRRGRGDRSRRCTTASCSAGRGSCRRTAPRSTPARSARPTRSPSTAPACAASARPTRRSATTC